MKTSTATPRADLYTRVTARVIADLEHGVRPWLKPWNAGHAAGQITLPLRHNGTPYRGINILLLWGEAMTNGYASPLWMTFKQALALGAHVRKGAHGAMVVYADRFTRTETDADGNGVEREIPFLKAYTVFNVAQIEGLAAHYYARPEAKADKLELIESAEQLCAATGAVIRHGGNMAYYAPGPDLIQLPVPEAFRDAESYAATKAHELTHRTKHPGRGRRRGGRAVRRALPRLDGREVETGTRDQRRGPASPLAVHGVGASLRRSLVASLCRKPWTPVDARCRLVPLNAGENPLNYC